ncbi:diguanylate cyclase (GGDEF) domain-containing protein [Propionispira arboris]|uniref:Diguanylate cyclase (GGDEF) domain-containing protein n=2 Tax=Propionispira arboris TaxID=84035 RepID=A0A1H6VML2_9FIRM|nr:diguanylate cyclase (GGDEF) domain-containing protein [Propionispira arboris]
MKYTGRLLGTIITFLVILMIRIYAYLYLDYSWMNLPIPGIIVLGVVYWSGKKYDEAKFFSEKDELTGLYNRRFIQKSMPMILQNTKKIHNCLGIVLIDCNDFKVINDTYGHAKGDLVLQKIAETFNVLLETNDIAARWGGDEFLVILHRAKFDALYVWKEKLAEHMSDLSSQLGFSITLSVGVSSYPQEGSEFEYLVSTADKDMYAYKERHKGKKVYNGQR